MDSGTSFTTQLVSGLHCEVHGDTGDWIVLIQGLGGHASFWTEPVKAFSSQAHVVIYDHAGIGRSVAAGGRRSIAEMSGDLLAVLNAVGAPRAHIVGHSMGGLIAQSFALDFPERVRSLTIGGSFAAVSNYLRLLLEFRRDVLQKLGPAGYCRFQTLSTTPRNLFEEQLDRVLEKEARSLNASSNVQIVADRINAILAFDRRDALAALRMPTLILAAEDDSFVPWQDSQRLAEHFHEAEFRLLESGGHFFPQFMSRKYIGMLGNFFQSVSQSA